MKFFFPKFENFYENHPPTRHIKYKKVDFAPIIISIMNQFGTISKADLISAYALIALVSKVGTKRKSSVFVQVC